MASLSSFRASRSRNSSSNELNLRISLQDNTFPQASTAPDSEAGDLSAQPSDGSTTSSSATPGRREILRKAIARRKYRRWPTDPLSFAEDDPREVTGDGLRVDGIVERAGGEDEEVIVPTGSGGDGPEIERLRDRSNTGGRARKGSEDPVPERRSRGKPKKRKEISEIDMLHENQRGIFVCGIPMFSSKGLLNLDPAPWQNRLFRDSAVSIVDAQLPDPSWVWAWKSWYVDMTQDVDEEGWAYSFSFNPAFSWHGNHVWFHSFVRRRRWLRKRVKIPDDTDFSSCEGSPERPHGLNQDYFTIHSRQIRDGSSGVMGGRRKPRRSVMEGSEWTTQNAEIDDLEEEGLITDIPKLIRVLKIARLDRERIEVVERFLEEGGEEVAYLPDRIPDIMSLMIFQASRRQLLSLLIKELEKTNPSSPPSPPKTPPSQSSDLPPQQKAQSETSEPDEEAAKLRKHENLQKAIKSAEQEVRRLEYWSDVRGVATQTEGGLKIAEDQSDGVPLGLSGADTKWKGKEVEK